MAAPWEKYSPPAEESGPWSKFSAPETSQAPLVQQAAPPQSFLQNLRSNYESNVRPYTPEEQKQHGGVETALHNFGAGAGQTLLGPLMHPLDTLKGIGESLPPVQAYKSLTGQPTQGEQFGQNVVEGFKQHGLQEIPHLAGQAAGMLVGSKLPEIGAGAAEGAGTLGTGIRNAAIGDQDASVLKGLQVGPRSPKTLSTLKSVEGARPYLQGAQNLEDLQSKIPAAKAEIWSPYREAIEKIGGKQVDGPNGPTTVGDLENARLQTSALLRDLKARDPQAINLAQQKGLGQADLLDQEKSIQAALDPHLEDFGIDPKAIRKTFGNVAQVGSRVSGKSTLIEPDQPYGLGKIANLSIKQPLQAPQQVFEGLRDIVAGRPILKGKPTDIGIREGFRNAGPKPNLLNMTGNRTPFGN